MDIQFEAKQLFGIDLTDDQVQKILTYKDILLEWNQRINLTAINTPQDIIIKHMLDSMACVLAFKDSYREVIDIGTGAGFPGIVLGICFPHLQVKLVDSVGKKIQFCQHVVAILGLDSVHIIHNRAEVLVNHHKYQGAFDVAVARAVAPLPRLLPYLLPFVRHGGVAIAMKGEKAIEEIRMAHIEYANRIPYTLPGESKPRSLVVLSM